MKKCTSSSTTQLSEEANYVYSLLRAGNSLREVVLLSRYKYPHLKGVTFGMLVGRMLNILEKEKLLGNPSVS